MSSKGDECVFQQFGNCLLVNQDSAETLLSMLGCVNTEKWCNDRIIRTLTNASVFDGFGKVSGDFVVLLNAIKEINRNKGLIVLKSSRRPNTSPISFVDRAMERTRNKTKLIKKKRFRGPPFSFDACNIPSGSVLTLKRDPTVTCVVVGDPWVVDFGDGITKSFTERTKELIGSKSSTFLSPMHYWEYNGELLRVLYNNVQCADLKPKPKPKKRGPKKKVKVSDEQEVVE